MVLAIRSLIVLILLLQCQAATATRSIVALDPATGQIGGASATCTPWAWAISGVVPGRGFIVVEMITDPDFDPSFARQQHGVVGFRFEPDAAGSTGTRTGRVRGDIQAGGVSVQGNILANKDVLTTTMQEQTRQLLDWVAANGFEATSPARVAGYDPPWTIPFLRRNEVSVDIR